MAAGAASLVAGARLWNVGLGFLGVSRHATDAPLQHLQQSLQMRLFEDPPVIPGDVLALQRPVHPPLPAVICWRVSLRWSASLMTP